MYSFINGIKPEAQAADINNGQPQELSEEDKRMQAILSNLFEEVKTQTIKEYNAKLYNAMNIWHTIGNIHSDNNQKIIYLTMSKSLALLIDRSLLSPEEVALCEEVLKYEPEFNPPS